ncbi:MAG: DinB family protein [Bacteroidota bacterium]
MTQVQKLIQLISESRNQYLKTVALFSEKEAQAKPNPEVWNVVENTEHLFWAEQGGLLGMWKILDALRNGDASSQNYEALLDSLSVEEIIAKTWKEKEIVPPVAAPRLGGTIAFWAASLHSLQSVLEKLGNELSDNDLQLLTHPHPISGILNFHQRLEFLRFHIDRHHEQIKRIGFKEKN